MSAEEFALEAMGEDGISVSRDDGQLIATCTEHKYGKINTRPVHELAAKHGLDVERSLADMDAGNVRVFLEGPRGDEA